MKTICCLLLLVICITTVSYAQKTYSYENLEKMSQHELNEHYLKALTLQKTGKTFNKVGMISFGIALSGAITAATISGSEAFYIGAAVALFGGALGLVSVAIGIPVKETGTGRINRIDKINASRGIGACLDLKPTVEYNTITREYHRGITVAINF